MEVRESHDLHSLTALRKEWDSLLDRCGDATIYQTWEWNEAWWRSFGRGKRLRLVQVRHQGQIAGIAPLYVSPHFRTPLRRLAFLGTGDADYLDIIADRHVRDAVSVAVLRYLTSTGGFDLADLQQLRPESILRVHGDTEIGRFRCMELSQEPCPFLSLPESWQELAAGFSRKMRSNIGYYDRLLVRSFESVEFRIAESGDLHKSMAALFDLHQRRWKERLLPGVLGSARTQSFHRNVAERFLEKGWLRLHMVRVDGRDAAALYCFHFRSRCYYYLGGFAPDLAKYSVGTVLTARAIQTAIDEGCADFDFLRGNEPYKYRWQPEERLNVRLLLADPRRIRTRAMLALNRLERHVEHHAKAFAEKRGRRKSK